MGRCADSLGQWAYFFISGFSGCSGIQSTNPNFLNKFWVFWICYPKRCSSYTGSDSGFSGSGFGYRVLCPALIQQINDLWNMLMLNNLSVYLVYFAKKLLDESLLISFNFLFIFLKLEFSLSLAADLENAKAVGWVLKIGIPDSTTLF